MQAQTEGVIEGRSFVLRERGERVVHPSASVAPRRSALAGDTHSKERRMWNGGHSGYEIPASFFYLVAVLAGVGVIGVITFLGWAGFHILAALAQYIGS